jgi:hypothetical protein
MFFWLYLADDILALHLLYSVQVSLEHKGDTAMVSNQQKEQTTQQKKGALALLNKIGSRNQDVTTVDEYHARSRGGLWGIFFYLAASAVAFHCKDQSLATVVPAHIMQQLGPVPPVFMATIVLWISTFSALSIIAGRLYHGTQPSSTLTHVAFRIGFFALFFMVGGLGQYMNELFVSGLVVLALQHCNVFNYYANALERTAFEGCRTLQKNSL